MTPKYQKFQSPPPSKSKFVQVSEPPALPPGKS